jgi:hypothetical protein
LIFTMQTIDNILVRWFTVIQFCFSVAITDLSANTAIKFKFRTFYAMKLTKNV